MAQIVPHEITVARMRMLLESLNDQDVLAPNSLRNLSILRAGRRIGHIDLDPPLPHVELYDAHGWLITYPSACEEPSGLTEF